MLTHDAVRRVSNLLWYLIVCSKNPKNSLKTATQSAHNKLFSSGSIYHPVNFCELWTAKQQDFSSFQNLIIKIAFYRNRKICQRSSCVKYQSSSRTLLSSRPQQGLNPDGRKESPGQLYAHAQNEPSKIARSHTRSQGYTQTIPRVKHVLHAQETVFLSQLLLISQFDWLICRCR